VLVSKERQEMWIRLQSLILPNSWKASKLGVTPEVLNNWKKGDVPLCATMHKVADAANLDWDFIRDGASDHQAFQQTGFVFWLEKYRATKSKARRRAFVEIVSKSYQYIQDRYDCELHINCDVAEILLPLDKIWTFCFKFTAAKYILIEVSLLHYDQGRVHFSGEFSEFALKQGLLSVKKHLRMHDATTNELIKFQQARDNALKFIAQHNGK
jgi:hypothetical protein